MKKLLSIFLLIFTFTTIKAQTPFPNTIGRLNPKTLDSVPSAVRATLGFINGVYADTTAANVNPYFKYYNGAQIMTTTGGVKIWFRYNGLWNQISGSGGSGWDLFGNTLTNPLAFLGSINNYDLNFGTSNLKRFSLDKDGIKAYNSDVMPWGIDTTDGKVAYSIIPTSYIQNALIGDTAFVPLSSNSYLFKSDVWGYGLLSANNSDTTKGAKVDTANSITSRLQAQHLIDSLAATISGGGSQTPWLSNINGANYGLDSVGWLRVGVSGGIITENEAFYSEQPQNASYYGSVDVTITGNQALDVEGNLTLAELNITNAGSNFVRNTNSPDLLVTPGDTYVFSMDIKQGTLSSGYYSVYDVTHSANIIAPTLFSIPAGLATRFTSASFVIPAGCTEIYIYPARDVPSTGTYFVGRLQVAHVGNAYIQTTTAQAPPSGSGGYLTAISTDSVTANIGLHGAPDATFNTTEYGSLQLLGDSLYSPNLPLLPLDSANYKLDVIKTSDGKHVRMNWPTAAATVPLSGITAGTTTNTVSNGGNAFTISNTSSITFFGGNSATSSYSYLNSIPQSSSMLSFLSNATPSYSQILAGNSGTTFLNKKLISYLRNTVSATDYYIALDSNHIKFKADSISVIGGLPTGIGTKAVRIDANGRLFQADTTTSGSSLAIGSTITSATVGSVLFVGTGGKLMQKNSDFFYDSTNKRLGIGTAVPSDMVHLKGASSNGLTVEGSQPMLTLNATSNDPQLTLIRGGNSSNIYVNSSTQLIVQGYNEVKVQQSGTTGFGIFSYVGGSFNSAFSIGSTSSPTSTLQSYGSFATAYVAKTGTYSATDYDHTIDCTSGTFTVTLPTASGITGREYTIKNTGAGVITVGTTSGQFIDGTPNTSYTLPVLNKYVTVKSTNSGWIVIANN